MRAFTLVCAAAVAALAAAQAPEQIHLSFTGNTTQMHVAWATVGSTKTSTAFKWGKSPSALTSSGTAGAYEYTTGMYTPIMLMDGMMTGLEPNTQYFYTVGDNSTVYNFTNAPVRPGGKVYALLADFGVVNDVSITQLTNEANNHVFDAVIHAGDFAYDLDYNGGELGNDFMNQMQPIVAYYPYMGVVGNHEYASNFSAWKARFYGMTQVGDNSKSNTNMYYSFNDGLVHWVALDTEMWWTNQSTADINEMYNWLQADLKAVDRSVTPWVVAYGHKQGWMDNVNFTVVAELLYQGGTNLYICGHQHNYQRLLPQYNNVVEQCYNEDMSVYSNCRDMTTIVVGSPGCRENISTGLAPVGIAKSSETYGYAHLTVVNESALYVQWEQTLQRDEHGRFTPKEGSFWDSLLAGAGQQPVRN